MPTETTKEAEPDVPPTCAVGMLIPVRCRPLHLLHHQQLRKAVSIAPETRGTGWTRFLNRGDEVPGGLPSPRSPKKSENPRSVDQNNEVRNPGKTAKPLPLSARSNWHAPNFVDQNTTPPLTQPDTGKTAPVLTNSKSPRVAAMVFPQFATHDQRQLRKIVGVSPAKRGSWRLAHLIVTAQHHKHMHPPQNWKPCTLLTKNLKTSTQANCQNQPLDAQLPTSKLIAHRS